MEDEDGERGTVGEEGSHSLICHPLTVTDINLLVIGDRYMLCYLARHKRANIMVHYHQVT